MHRLPGGRGDLPGRRRVAPGAAADSQAFPARLQGPAPHSWPGDGSWRSRIVLWNCGLREGRRPLGFAHSGRGVSPACAARERGASPHARRPNFGISWRDKPDLSTISAPRAIRIPTQVRRRILMRVCLLPVLALCLLVFSSVTRLNPSPPPLRPGARVVLDAHNCYPYYEWWFDRIDRALSAGTPLAIEQDLLWAKDPKTGAMTSVVSHGAPATGREPG